MRCINLIFILYGLYELGVGVLQCFHAFKYSLPYQTISGTLDNPGPYSIIIALILPIAWDYILRFKYISKKGWRLQDRILIYLSYIYILLSVFVLPYCMSRTAWVAVILGCGIVTSLYIGRKRKVLWKLLCVGGVILFTSCCVIGFYTLKKESADGRLLIWKVSSLIIKQNLFVGVGKGNFSYAYGEAQEQYFKMGTGTTYEEYLAGAPDFAYNEFIQILVEYGIYGLLCYFAFLFFIFNRIIRSNNKESQGLMGSLVVFLVVSFFSYPFRNIFTCILSLSIFTLAILIPTNTILSKKIYRIRFISILFVLLIVSIAVYRNFGMFGNTKVAYNQWNLLKPYYNDGQFGKISALYEPLYPFLKENALFLLEYGRCLSYCGRYEKSNLVLKEGSRRSSDPMFFNIIGKNYQQLGDCERAEEMFYKAYFRIPHKIYPLFLLMNLYEQEGRVEDMLSIASQAINKKEKVHSRETIYLKNEIMQKMIKYSSLKCTY